MMNRCIIPLFFRKLNTVMEKMGLKWGDLRNVDEINIVDKSTS